MGMELAWMANAVYDLHERASIRKDHPSLKKLVARDWKVEEEHQQPHYPGGYPTTVALAVFVKGRLAVLAHKGTSGKQSASDLHIDVSSIIGGVPPCVH